MGCQGMFDKRDLLRVVKTADGIELDVEGRKDGRGAYLCRNEACLETAIKKRGLERSLKTPVSITVYENLREEMKQIVG